MSDSRSPFPDDVPDMRLPERDPMRPDETGAGKATPKLPEGYALQGESPAPSAWKRGDRVLAPWEPMFLYAGTIEKVSAGRALIEFDDGDSGWVELVHVQQLRLKRGQHVLSRRRMGPLFFPGQIMYVKKEDLRVEFDDGQEEQTTVAAVRIPCEPKGRGAEQIEATSNTAFLKHLRNGDRVWALWNNSALFPGTVSAMRDDDAKIRFDDGDQAWVRLEHLLPLELMVGMFVMGRFRMGPQFFPGTITEVDEERIHIRYDDGDTDWTTAAALALPLQQPPPRATPRDMGAEAGWNPRLVLVLGGVALVAVALIAYWLGRP